MRYFIRSLALVCLLTASVWAQSTAPVLSQAIPAPELAQGGAAVTIDLRNYFAVPGLTAPPAGFTSIFPTGGGTPVITFTIDEGVPSVVSLVLSGSTLTVTPVGGGNGTIRIRAADREGRSATASFAVTISTSAPTFTLHPRALTVAPGGMVVLDATVVGAATYRWERDGQAVANGSSRVLVIPVVSASDAGNYRLVATSSLGTATSNPAQLQVTTVAPQNMGRLSNLSILTTAGAGEKVLTVGAVVGPLNATGALPLIVRAVGPSLAAFSVPNLLPDPTMTFYAAGSSTSLDSNDNWGGSPALRTAFESVGAFALAGDSLDSAILRPLPGVGVGGYTVQVTGKGSSQGNVLAEIYDAAGSSRTGSAPRLINVSTLTQVDVNADLAVGFVIAGQTAKTVLIRGAGPALTRLGVAGVMPDPRLELFDNSNSQRISTNDDWSGALEVGNAAVAVGAFPYASGTSKDAAIIVTLPPGPYSARLAGVGGVGGTAIVEVYEVP
ncbi:MAG: immunoglobulin domain-containing protein [Verrucomicrobiota bacterium]